MAQDIIAPTGNSTQLHRAKVLDRRSVEANFALSSFYHYNPIYIYSRRLLEICGVQSGINGQAKIEFPELRPWEEPIVDRAHDLDHSLASTCVL